MAVTDLAAPAYRTKVFLVLFLQKKNRYTYSYELVNYFRPPPYPQHAWPQRRRSG
jgi:hypothetical protein